MIEVYKMNEITLKRIEYTTLEVLQLKYVLLWLSLLVALLIVCVPFLQSIDWSDSYQTTIGFHIITILIVTSGVWVLLWQPHWIRIVDLMKIHHQKRGIRDE
jgi:hypothetical protein